MSAERNDLARSVVHHLWCVVTEDGKLDSTAADVEALFDRVRDNLRARYNIEIPSELTDARIQAVHLAKVRVLSSLRCPRMEAP